MLPPTTDTVNAANTSNTKNAKPTRAATALAASDTLDTLATLDALDALLPQTQCQRCGYADCHAYASAMHLGEATHNRCPPGGDATRLALAALLGETPIALADDVDAYAPEQVAVIDEAACIGCAKCLPVCPTDAIIGASKRMHTVIPNDCTGCELCIIACPVDCIDLAPRVTPANQVHLSLEARAPQAAQLRLQYGAHKLRLLERTEEREHRHKLKPSAVNQPPAKSALLAGILAKAKARAEQ